MNKVEPSPAPVTLRVESPEVGMLTLDGNRREVVVQLFEAGVRLPCTIEKHLRYAYDGTTAVRLELTAGPGARREDVVVIGRLELTGLPPRKRGSPLILRIERSADLIDAELVDVETGTSRSLRVTTLLLA